MPNLIYSYLKKCPKLLISIGFILFITTTSFSAPLLYSTFLGGNSDDYASGSKSLAFDSSGNIYIIGYTASDNFPVTAGAISTTFHDYIWDAFVTKFNSTGTSLIFSTYLGGTTGDSYGNAIVIDTAGNAYLTGSSHAEEFPVTAGSYDTSYNFGGDCYVMKLSPTGSLLNSTWIGGSATDSGEGIALDSVGNVVVAATGETAYTPLAYNTTDVHTFVAKFTPGLSSTLFVTGLETINQKVMRDLALDKAGNIYVTGYMFYSFSTVPDSDVFVYKLNPSGTSLIYKKLFGGESYDEGHAIAADSAGNAYVTGFSQSNTFPYTTGAWNTNTANFNGFIAKISPNGSTYQFLTLLNGVGDGIAIDSVGNVFVTGEANQLLQTTPGCFKPSVTYYGPFLLKLHSSGSTVLYSSFLDDAGSYYNSCVSIIPDTSNGVWLVGATDSYTYPVTTTAFQSTKNAYHDIFLTHLSLNPIPVADFYATPSSGLAPLNVSFFDTSTIGAPAISWAWDFGDGFTGTVQNPSHSYATTGYFDVTLTVTGTYGSSSIVRPYYIQVNDTLADFYATPRGGYRPLSVAFHDASTTGNIPISWQWTFGDGSTSNLQNPTHVYTSYGFFTVSLTTHGNYGSNYQIKSDYIVAFDSTQQKVITGPSFGQPTLFFLGTDTCYTPFILYVYTTTGVDTVTVTVFDGKHPNRPTDSVISRWYRVSSNGKISLADIYFGYIPQDIYDAGVGSPYSLKGFKYDNGNWTYLNPNFPYIGNFYYAEFSYVTSFSDWTLGVQPGATNAPLWELSE